MMDSETVTKQSKITPTALAASLAILASLLRLFPHPWNFAPMGAIGIFAGAKLRGWLAFVLPVGLSLITDLVLWMRYPEYSPFQPFTYISYALCVLLGRCLVRNAAPWRIIGMGLVSSVVFFLVTNFGAWVQWTHLYPRTFAGLMECYAKGIPFYRGTFFGDLIYTPVLFGAYALIVRLAAEKKPVEAEAIRPEAQA